MTDDTLTGGAKAAADGEFQPRITAFVCNWCTYTGADLAGTSRLHMASNVRIIRLPCTGRIDPLFIIKAFERGADGVIVSGCHPADCHYTAGNYHARRRFGVFRELLTFMGIDPQRLTFSVSAPVSTSTTWLMPTPKRPASRMRYTQERNFCVLMVPSKVSRGSLQLSQAPQLSSGYTSPKCLRSSARRHPELWA